MLLTDHRRRNADLCARRRPLRLESLEDRRMLATMVVTDLGDGSLAQLSGDGQLSLREAVEAINTGAPVDGIGPIAGTFGTDDTILFSTVQFLGSPRTIQLAAGQLDLEQSVLISGPLGGLLTIDAQQNSRIFNIIETAGDVTFGEMTLTGGMTTGFGEQGGAIRSLAVNQLTILNAVLEDNATLGDFSTGGAVSTFGSLDVVDSTIQRNRTEGTGSVGGGVSAQLDVAVIRSTVADNRTEGDFASGGGISAAGSVSLASSTVSGNRAEGAASAGGGVLAAAGIELTESTVSGNQTTAIDASGGGINAGGTINITRSTIFENSALGTSATGGGINAVPIFILGDGGETITTQPDITVTGSIIANNTAGASNADIQPGSGTLTVDFSLVRDAVGLGIPAATNLLGIDPALGPLSGGGQTKTHAPLPSSPVIDAGDPALASPPPNDQRGVGFARIANGGGGNVIDIGSHEVQDVQTSNFDGDGNIDGQDFLAWQRGFGAANASISDGDSDQDGDVDN
ncbi:MAG: choice-of-anchor Q domain-containing protein, partial [Planctomycetota bacterium]